MLEEVKKKITFNQEYLNWMEEIVKIEKKFADATSFNNQVALDHGIKHMNRVADMTYKLLKEYGEDERTCFLGYVAGLIHDIGMIDGKKKHASKGSEMAPKFLKKLNVLIEDEIQIVANAIAIHGSGEGNSIIGSFLAIADKIDMCEERTLGGSSPIKLIKEYQAYIKNDTLCIDYVMSSMEGKIGLYIIPKSIDIPIKVGNDLGLKVEFYVNHKLENFIDRKDYHGEIYIRNINNEV